MFEVFEVFAGGHVIRRVFRGENETLARQVLYAVGPKQRRALYYNGKLLVDYWRHN